MTLKLVDPGDLTEDVDYNEQLQEVPWYHGHGGLIASFFGG